MCIATIALIRRFTRFLVTAFPIALDTTKPTDGPSCMASSEAMWTTMVDFPVRAPPPTVRPKSPERRIRCAAGNTEIRQRARHGPYGGELRESSGLRGCACAAGSRESLHDAGCSAGRSAWSRGTPKTLGKRILGGHALCRLRVGALKACGSDRTGCQTVRCQAATGQTCTSVSANHQRCRPCRDAPEHVDCTSSERQTRTIDPESPTSMGQMVCLGVDPWRQHCC
jgi:hypothetical protein